MRKETLSFCPECYGVIPACIYNKDGKAVMTKVCRDHGVFESVVENDYRYWLWCNAQKTEGIYDGYMIDLTPRCNMKCEYCIHSKCGSDRSEGEIMAELENMPKHGSSPIILFGGEPTIHHDFFDLTRKITKKYGHVSVVTNGTMTADNSFFKELANLVLFEDGITSIHVSIHKESNGSDLATLENARKNGVKLGSILCVIDDLSQVKEYVSLFDSYSDVVEGMRLKSACNAWREGKAKERIYVSDMLKELNTMGLVRHVGKNNVTSFCNVLLDDKLHIMPICWYDTKNVDLVEIDRPPWYRAKDGIAYNTLTTFLVNEGIEKGFYMGNNLEDIANAA